MRRTCLGVLVLLAVSACGGADTGATTSLGPLRDSTPGSVDGPWAGTLSTIKALRAGSYEATLVTQRCARSATVGCQLTSQTIRNAGSFSTGPNTVSSELRIERPASEGGPASIVQMRELADGTLYSLDPAGNNVCWLQWEPAYRWTFEGAVRTGLEVLRSTTVTYDVTSTSKAIDTPARANALAVVRTLGLAEALDNSYGITPQIKQELAAKTVTITLKVERGGSPVGFQVDGRRVATEIAPGNINAASGYLAAVRDAWSSFSVSDFGKAPQVAAPPVEQVVAQSAPAGSLCAAAG